MKGFVLFILCCLILVTSCSKKENQYLEEMNIQIPVALKDNEAVLAYVNTSSDYLNSWSDKLCEMYNKCQSFSAKEESELTVSDLEILGKAMMDYMAGMGQFTVGMAEIENQGVSLQAQFPDEGQIAMDTILNKLRDRVSEINQKYQSLNNNN
jgi:hypothetical protein